MTLQDIISGIFSKVLRPYQLQWIAGLEAHNWAAILGGRQIGKDYTLAFYAVAKALLEPGSEWNTFSASAKHAERWLRDCRVSYKLIASTCGALGAPLPALGDAGRKNNVTQIEFHNGSIISSHASSVRSRGSTGNAEWEPTPLPATMAGTTPGSELAATTRHGAPFAVLLTWR